MSERNIFVTEVPEGMLKAVHAASEADTTFFNDGDAYPILEAALIWLETEAPKEGIEVVHIDHYESGTNSVAVLKDGRRLVTEEAWIRLSNLLMEGLPSKIDAMLKEDERLHTRLR